MFDQSNVIFKPKTGAVEAMRGKGSFKDGCEDLVEHLIVEMIKHPDPEKIRKEFSEPYFSNCVSKTVLHQYWSLDLKADSNRLASTPIETVNKQTNAPRK